MPWREDELVPEEGAVDIVAVSVEHQEEQEDKTHGLDRRHSSVAKRLTAYHLDDDEEDVPSIERRDRQDIHHG